MLVDREAQPEPPAEPPDLPPLQSPEEIYQELRHEVLRLEVCARRLGQARQEWGGRRDKETGELVTGLNFEWEAAMAAVNNKLWADYNDEKIRKWPGEDVRKTMARDWLIENDKEWVVTRRDIVKAEVDNLESYARIVRDRIEGLRSMLAYRRQEADLTNIDAAQDWGSQRDLGR